MKSQWLLLWLLLSQLVCAQDLPDSDIHVFQLVKGELVSPTPVAISSGYDNQPHFTADSQRLYYTRIEQDNADIWTWSPAEGQQRVCSTPESEYSPTPLGDGLSTVRVEKDGTQRLWEYKQKQGFRLLHEAIKPVGYHVWCGPDLGLFILGEPHSLQVLSKGQAKPAKLAENIGRCLQKIPGRRAISFTVTKGERHDLVSYDLDRGMLKALRSLPRGSQDYTWLNQDTVLSSNGKQILYSKAHSAEPWKILKCRTPLQGITRLALSPDRKKLAVVHLKSGWLW